jgi:hypothetical protein
VSDGQTDRQRDKALFPPSFDQAEGKREVANESLIYRNFTIPYEYPTTFAEANITICKEGKLENSVSHYNPGPMNGTVFGLVD